jgi:hypothetical protein
MTYEQKVLWLHRLLRARYGLGCTIRIDSVYSMGGEVTMKVFVNANDREANYLDLDDAIEQYRRAVGEHIFNLDKVMEEMP